MIAQDFLPRRVLRLSEHVHAECEKTSEGAPSAVCPREAAAK